MSKPKDISKQKDKQFATYITRYLKDKHPENGITREGRHMLNKIVVTVGENIACNIMTLLAVSGKKTIAWSEVMYATETYMSNELGKHALAYAQQAVNKYTAAERTAVVKRKQQYAGLVFAVARAKVILRQYSPKKTRISEQAPVALAAILEYVASEIIDLAIAEGKDKTRITPRHISLAIQRDLDFYEISRKWILVGVVPMHGKKADAEASE